MKLCPSRFWKNRLESPLCRCQFSHLSAGRWMSLRHYLSPCTRWHRGHPPKAYLELQRMDLGFRAPQSCAFRILEIIAAVTNTQVVEGLLNHFLMFQTLILMQKPFRNRALSPYSQSHLHWQPRTPRTGRKGEPLPWSTGSQSELETYVSLTSGKPETLGVTGRQQHLVPLPW